MVRVGGGTENLSQRFVITRTFHSACMLTNLMYMKLSYPCFASIFGLMDGRVDIALPQKYCERKPWRGTENSFTSSSIVTGKISNPTLESLVKTEVSSNDFLSDLSFVYQKYGAKSVTLREVLGGGSEFRTFRMRDRALDTSRSTSCFTAGAVTLSSRFTVTGSIRT